MILDRIDVDPEELRRRTGWDIKPEGACKADMCVPIPDPGEAEPGRVDARVLSERLGMALVEDEAHGLWALGPDSGGRALASAELPELVLPDRDGRPFNAASLRGTRWVMVAWASW